MKTKPIYRFKLTMTHLLPGGKSVTIRTPNEALWDDTGPALLNDIAGLLIASGFDAGNVRGAMCLDDCVDNELNQ